MTPLPEFSMEAMMEPFKKVVARYGLILWLGVTLVTILGFRFLSPNERIAKVEANVTQLQMEQRADSEVRETMVRWMCVKSSPREIVLSGLRCQ